MPKRTPPARSDAPRPGRGARKRFARETLAAVLTAAVTTAVVSTLQLIPWKSAWWWVLGLSLLILVLAGLHESRDAPTEADARRRRALLLLGVVTALAAGGLAWTEWVGPRTYRPDPSEVALLLGNRRWITYEPRGFDPLQAQTVDPASIRAELALIQQAGFDGVITFTSNGAHARIPRIAHRMGMAVIMGVWNPADERELAAAAAQRRYVKAYAVGHNGVDWLYSHRQLEAAVSGLRFRTRRPVATTELFDHYHDARLLRVGDWIFPDAHVSLRRSQALGDTAFATDALAGAAQTMAMAQRLAERRPDARTPILLKMVMYPVAGASGASEAEQKRFFHALLENRRDAVSRLPRDVRVAVHGAFDAPWKGGRWPFYPWDPHTGLLDSLGRARPAVREIVQGPP
jgi:hypothetical protein